MRIFQLQHEGTVIEREWALKVYITSYYKDLFRTPKKISFSLDESRVEDIVQVSQEGVCPPVFHPVADEWGWMKAGREQMEK
jgi:hypothetical protein